LEGPQEREQADNGSNGQREDVTSTTFKSARLGSVWTYQPQVDAHSPPVPLAAVVLSEWSPQSSEVVTIVEEVQNEEQREGRVEEQIVRELSEKAHAELECSD
jgi:hypothetical protein